MSNVLSSSVHYLLQDANGNEKHWLSRIDSDKVGYEDIAGDEDEEPARVRRKSSDGGGGQRGRRPPLQAHTGAARPASHTQSESQLECKENVPYSTSPCSSPPSTTVTPVSSPEVNNNCSMSRHKDTFNEPLNVNMTDSYLDSVTYRRLSVDQTSSGLSSESDSEAELPPKKRLFPRTLKYQGQYQGQIQVTDITHNCVTVTFLESPTEKGFFKEQCS